MSKLLGLALVALTFQPAQPPPAQPPPAPKPNCKAFQGGKCCDASIAAHLPKEAVYRACGASEDSFLGEQGSKDTCRYFFKAEGGKPEDSFVQVYAPPTKQVPSAPNDPFFTWKKLGKVFLADKAKSPKAAAMVQGSIGLWMPGSGYFVTVNASTKVCSRKDATKLAAAMK